MSPSTLPPVLSRALLALALYTFAAWVLIGTAWLAWAPGRSLAASTLSHVALAVSGASPSAAVGAAAVCDMVAPWNQVQAVAYGYEDNGDDDFRWGLLGDDENFWFDDDSDRSARSKSGGAKAEPRFWFRDHGTEYVVTDPAIVAEVQTAVHPLAAIGKEMGEVGGEMGRHGARMGRIGGRMGAASARLAMVQARLAARSSRASDRAAADASLSDLRLELRELREQLEKERSENAGQQQELSRRMSELSANHQAAMKRVRQQVREIATRARREGKAERPHANA